MSASIGEKITETLKAKAERGRENCVAYHWHVVKAVMEAERKTNHQQLGADLDMFLRLH